MADDYDGSGFDIMAYGCTWNGWSKLFNNDGIMEMINWKEIEGYPRYAISEDGKVKNVKTGRILRQGVSSNGYYQIVLCKDGNEKAHTVHRLVAKAFIPASDYSKSINHIDGCKTNNHFTNLEWCTKKHNTNHAFEIGLINTRKPINQLTIEGDFIKEWKSIMEAERQLGINHPNICAAALGKRKTAGKFKWKYLNI